MIIYVPQPCTYLDCETRCWAHRLTLIDHYTFLVEEMEAEGALLNLLYQHEVLDEQEVAEMNALSVRQRKNVKLLDFLMRTSSAQYDRLLEALKKSSQEHVQSELCNICTEGMRSRSIKAPACLF